MEQRHHSITVMAEIYRHGDVLLTKIESIPKEAKKIAGATLALGEVTGHHHSFTSGTVQLYEPKTATDGVKYVDVATKSASLTHQEHKEIRVPQGQYKMSIEREYNPMDKVIRQVMD